MKFQSPYSFKALFYTSNGVLIINLLFLKIIYPSLIPTDGHIGYMMNPPEA